MKKYFWKFATVAVILLYIWTVGLGNDVLQPGIASKILRFHVIANSDTELDQEAKEAVRDAVGYYLNPMLEGAGSLQETKEIVNQHLEEIVEIAQETLLEYGLAYSVEARITTTHFPEKTYGSYKFPKGQYEAAQVLGMTPKETFFTVVLMQVVKRILAPMSNEVITLVKDTALARVIMIVEIIQAAQNYAGYGYMWPLFYTAVFYLAFVGILTLIFGYCERKLSYFKA